MKIVYYCILVGIVLRDMIYMTYCKIIRKQVSFYTIFGWNIEHAKSVFDKIITKETKEKPEKRKKESHFPLRKWQKSKGEM